MIRSLTLCALLTMSGAAAHAETVETSAGAVQLDAIVSGLEEPWGFGFLPGGGVLITERDGRLLHVKATGESAPVGGLPEIEVGGQGGLLDVMIPGDFATSRDVFLSFSIPQGRGAGTGLAVGRLSADGKRLENTRVIFESAMGSRGGRHFGSRIVEAQDGTLFLTIGDRGDDDSAQELENQNGTVVRVNRDGSVPSTNPFIGRAGAQPEIWSYGHRNAQGAALDLSGELWVVEHGARGGDEINKVTPGANYGWPVISYGRHYSGLKIGEGTEKAGMEQPVHYWDPSIAPSGMMIYSGALWPEWRGDIFVGSLKFGYLSRLDGDNFAEEEIEADATARTRDVREGPNGAIWFLSVGNGTLYRMTPGEGS